MNSQVYRKTIAAFPVKRGCFILRNSLFIFFTLPAIRKAESLYPDVKNNPQKINTDF